MNMFSVTENLGITTKINLTLGFYISNAKVNLDIMAETNLTLGFVYLMPKKIWA